MIALRFLLATLNTNNSPAYVPTNSQSSYTTPVVNTLFNPLLGI
jgi:hypothetical protein